jgi:hypothetical protein
MLADYIEPHMTWGDFSQIGWTTKKIPGSFHANGHFLVGMEGINF